MAVHKSKRSRKPRSSSRPFSEITGKTVELVEIDDDAQTILILFDDHTALGFSIDSSHVVFPELSSRKGGNWKPLKRWPPIYSPISMVRW